VRTFIAKNYRREMRVVIGNSLRGSRLACSSYLSTQIAGD
jgi:hypothetical protein